MRWIAAVGLLALALWTPRALAEWDEDRFLAKAHPTYRITPPQGEEIGETLIGQVRLYRIKKGDTLMDLARYWSLGYNEIVQANPGLDPWVPPVGAVIVLPTEWILPCCTFNGVIVNIPEMRLFYMRPGGDGTVLVTTYPVGLGRDEWRTPTGSFKIAGKTVNPQWNIPASIREEHIRERDDHRTFIPGGAPDNPLGKFRLELTMPMYRIHGTDIPWGVGMQVSHGCVRLYPEDIEQLFPQIPVGAPGAFVYQTIKVGRRGGAVWAEVHEDIYGKTPAFYHEALGILAKQGLTDAIDQRALLNVIEGSGGIPFRISPDPNGPPLDLADHFRDGDDDDDRPADSDDDQARVY